MNKKQTIRINKSHLRRIVKKSAKKVLKESEDFDFDEFDEEEFIDRNGKQISIGSKVIWYDPDKSKKDLKRIWTVYNLGGSIVYISDDSSEAEVYPNELKVIG